MDLTQYAGLFIYLILGFSLILGVFVASYLFRERGNDPLRKSIYECGMETIGSPYVSPNIRFYVYALIFVVFDTEIVFILPWATQFRQLGMVGFVEMMVFISILFVALIYAWKKGAMKWE